MIIIDKKIELTETELEKAMKEKGYNGFLYIVSFRAIYEITYSNNGGWQWKRLFTAKGSITKRGRFIFASAFDVNSILHYKCLNDGTIEYKDYYIKFFPYGCAVLDGQYRIKKNIIENGNFTEKEIIAKAKECINNLNKNI